MDYFYLDEEKGTVRNREDWEEEQQEEWRVSQMSGWKQIIES